MARIEAPPTIGLGLLYGAVGGLFSGVVYLAVLAVGASVSGYQPVAGVNAVGAFFVTWLQTAAPQAFDNVYADATYGGIAVALLTGASLGAAFAGLIARLPDDHPLAWGALIGLGLYALTRWAILPALDPVLLRIVDGRALFAAPLVAGLALGAWLDAGRRFDP